MTAPHGARDAALELLPSVRVLGVPIVNATRDEAIAVMCGWMRQRDGVARGVYLVNAHTLNLACDDPAFRAVLTDGDAVFGDGTGVRIAARWKGVAMRDNLVGTDLVPALFDAMRDAPPRCYLLGGTPDAVARAAAAVRECHPWVDVVGFRDGYVSGLPAHAVVEPINASGADLLLVAMGNPLQERWIHDHRPLLRVPVSIGIGGLVDHWAGTLRRAAPWVRGLGIEWLQILLQQPAKWRRYMLGNPRFLWRALRDVRAS